MAGSCAFFFKGAGVTFKLEIVTPPDRVVLAKAKWFTSISKHISNIINIKSVNYCIHSTLCWYALPLVLDNPLTTSLWYTGSIITSSM